MSDTVAVLVTELRADDKTSKVLAALDAALLKTAGQADRAGAALGGELSAGQLRAAQAAAKLTQAEAQAGLAGAKTATEQQRLATALQQTVAAKARAEQATLRLAQAQEKAAKGTSSLSSQIASGLQGGLLGMVGPAAAATAALGGLVSVAESFQRAFVFKAELDASRQSITTLLGTTRDSGVVFSEAAAFARQYGFTQREITDAISASIPIMRQSKASTEETIGALARLAVLNPKEGIEGAAFALRELASGDITSLVERFNLSRDAARAMRDQIVGGKDAIVVLSQFLDQSGVSMETLENRTKGTLGAMNELKQAQEDLALAQAEWAKGPGLVVLQGQTTVLSGLTRVLTGDVEAMGQSWRNNMDAYARWIGLTDQAIISGGTWGQTMAEATVALDAHTRASSAQHQATAESTQAIQAHAAATEEAALKSQIAAVQAETLTIKKGQLAQQAQATANAMINSGQASEAAAARLAASSSLVDQLTAAYLRLNAAQQKPSAVAAKNEGFTGANRGGRIDAARARAQQIKEEQEIAAAQRAQTLAVGSTADKVALLTKEYERAKAVHGATSAEAIKAQTALLQATRAGASGAKGAAGVKLTDQQKLNNSLLAGQEKYQDQVEQATVAHLQRVAQIERDFQEKSLAQQRENEVAKRQSRADFYDSLTSATADVGQEVAQELSAAYEQAYAEAQAIAQAGNAKLAADYLALKERQLQAELEFQKRLAEARKNKDDAEVARLEAIHRLRQDANAEEEKNLREAGDANVNQRDTALADESQRFADQQDKMATSAENAADRQVNSAIRAGKEVDTLNAKYMETGRLLDGIAARTAGTQAGGTAPQALAPGTQAGAAPPIDVGAITGLLQSVIDTLNTQTGTLATAADRTTRAVGALSGKFLQ